MRRTEQEAADLARERNEFRLMRIDREKQERAQKHAQKALGAATEQPKAVATDDAAVEAKKAAIAAAIERAKAQKAASTPQNTENVTSAVKAEIAEIDARREAAKQAVTDINNQDEK